MYDFPALVKLIQEQENDRFRQLRLARVYSAKNKRSVFLYRLLNQRSDVAEDIQVDVVQMYRQCIIILSNKPHIAEYFDQRWKNDTIRRKFYWPGMTADESKIVLENSKAEPRTFERPP